MVSNDQRDGAMRGDGNEGSDPNTHPNSLNDIYTDKRYKEPPLQLDNIVADETVLLDDLRTTSAPRFGQCLKDPLL